MRVFGLYDFAKCHRILQFVCIFAEKMHTEMHTKTGLLVRVKNGLQPFLDDIVI